MSLPVTYSDIVAANERLEGQAIETPLLKSHELDRLTGASVFIKPESLQRTGSFKFRGAYNAISKLPAEDRSRGIVACSSGNHAQGIAAAAQIYGVPATIVMPTDAPSTKWKRTQAFGAQIVGYDRQTEDRDAVANSICEKSGATFIHPFENPNVIAGQGTVGLEIVEQMKACDAQPDALFVCCGGGGLAAGVALATRNTWPSLDVHPVEPEGFDDYARSLALGDRVANPQKSGSICDAIITDMPGKLSFEIGKEHFKPGLTVTDQEALAAVKFAFEELKLLVEPGGAVALAALLNERAPVVGRTIVIVLSGGNIDPKMLEKALAI